MDTKLNVVRTCVRSSNPTFSTKPTTQQQFNYVIQPTYNAIVVGLVGEGHDHCVRILPPVLDEVPEDVNKALSVMVVVAEEQGQVGQSQSTLHSKGPRTITFSHFQVHS